MHMFYSPKQEIPLLRMQCQPLWSKQKKNISIHNLLLLLFIFSLIWAAGLILLLGWEESGGP